MHRILELSNYYKPHKGGIENNTEFCAKILNSFAEVYVVVYNTSHKTTVQRIDGIPVIKLGSLGNFKSQEIAFGLIRIIRRINPDVIHLHTPNPLATIACFPFINKKKIVVTHHADIINKGIVGEIFKPLYQKFLRSIDSIIVYTHSYASNSNELKKFLNKVRIIPHGIEVEQLKTEKDELGDNKKYFQNGMFTIGYIGRLVEDKGVEILQEAVSHLKDVNLVIAGDGKLRDKLVNFGKQLSISDRCLFIGEVEGETKTRFFNNIDALVLPSFNESFGQVLVEGQLLEIPVVASSLDKSGIQEIVEDGKTGLLFETGNIIDLKNKLLNLKENVKLRERLKADAKEIAIKKYHTSSVAKKIQNHFKSEFLSV